MDSYRVTGLSVMQSLLRGDPANYFHDGKMEFNLYGHEIAIPGLSASAIIDQLPFISPLFRNIIPDSKLSKFIRQIIKLETRYNLESEFVGNKYHTTLSFTNRLGFTIKSTYAHEDFVLSRFYAFHLLNAGIDSWDSFLICASANTFFHHILSTDVSITPDLVVFLTPGVIYSSSS